MYNVQYNVYYDELSVELYSIDQMQGIKLTRSFSSAKSVRLQC